MKGKSPPTQKFSEPSAEADGWMEGGRVGSHEPQSRLKMPFLSFFVLVSRGGNSMEPKAMSSTMGLQGTAWKGGGKCSMEGASLELGSPAADS